MQEIEAAAEMVGAHEFIQRLPLGYDEEVGEGGNLLSVGQKQLLSLARAVLAEPDIFIMDEATSSVDTLTEALIQHGMDVLMAGRTSFVIAHRLSTIRNADRILVIENGGIAEMGSTASCWPRVATTTGSTRSNSRRKQPVKSPSSKRVRWRSSVVAPTVMVVNSRTSRRPITACQSPSTATRQSTQIGRKWESQQALIPISSSCSWALHLATVI